MKELEQTENAIHPHHPPYGPTFVGDDRPDLLVTQPEVREQVNRLVHAICHNQVLFEDLCQVALLCLWQAEATHPGKTLSWYKQRCRHCICDWLGAGRSVDSLKHSSLACPLDETQELGLPSEEDLVGEVCEQDNFDELMLHVDLRDQPILRLL
jgi:hypothetical protein